LKAFRKTAPVPLTTTITCSLEAFLWYWSFLARKTMVIVLSVGVFIT